MDDNSNLFLNTEMQETLRCSFCDKFLSVSPIFIKEGQFVCGRCSFIESEEGKVLENRQLVYEAAAQNMIFPCSNVIYGCTNRLHFDEVVEHEDICLYKKIQCPLGVEEFGNANKCPWKGSGPNLNEHIETFHDSLIKKMSDVRFHEIEEQSLIFFARVHRQLVTITIKRTSPEVFHCLVMVNGTSVNTDNYRYQLELHGNDKTNLIIFRRNRVEDSVAMAENMLNVNKTIVVDLSVVKNLLKQPEVLVGRFGILKKSRKELNSNPTVENYFDENFLRDLECPVCKNYLIPPIYLCQAGHSLCRKCKQQINQCPTCREPFGDARNFHMEKLVSCLNFPCVNRDAGCSVMVSSDKLREHEKDCIFASAACFMPRCNSTISLDNMFKHLNAAHKKSLLQVENITGLDFSEFGDFHEIVYAICFGNDIFKLHIEINLSTVKFTFQQYNVDESNYNYSIDIFNILQPTQAIKFTNPCSPLKPDIPAYSANVSSDIVDKFINEEDLLFFKLNLKKCNV